MRKSIVLILLMGILILPAIESPAMAQVSYYRSGDLIGKVVENRQGEERGRIDDVIADRNGRIRYLLIRPSFDRLDDRWVPVPWHAADLAVRDGDVIVDLPRNTLRNAPYFRRGYVPDMGQWENRILSYYGLAAPYRSYPSYGGEEPYYEPYQYYEPYGTRPYYDSYRGREDEGEYRRDRWEELEERQRPPRYFRGDVGRKEREKYEWDHRDLD